MERPDRLKDRILRRHKIIFADDNSTIVVSTVPLLSSALPPADSNSAGPGPIPNSRLNFFSSFQYPAVLVTCFSHSLAILASNVPLIRWIIGSRQNLLYLSMTVSDVPAGLFSL